MIGITDDEFSQLKDYLHRACGIDVPPAKRYLFETRLSGFLDGLGCKDFSEFYERLMGPSGAVLDKGLIEAMTTNETSFFRDGHPFEMLERELLPELAQRRREEIGDEARLRFLSAGCSTGEEPYSIAMVLSDWLESQEELTRDDVSVLAVDVSRSVLDHARAAVYAKERVGKDLPARFFRRHLEEADGGYRVVQEVRTLVSFAELSLSTGFEFLGMFDVIFCRNVVIYFSPELRQRILRGFHRMLLPGGALVLGASESTYGITGAFSAVHAGRSTWYVKV